MKIKVMASLLFIMLFVYTESGFSQLHGTTEPTNSFYGVNAGISIPFTGIHDTFIGAEAGSDNSSGANNTFVGYAAGSRNTYGTNNTFLGFKAGYSNTVGYYNIFIGSEAGYSNVDDIGTGGGWYNVFLGNKAGRGNTTGSENTFIGDGAGYTNSSGSWNMFLGSSAGSSNTTGDENTFIGDYAGYSNATGEKNIYLGNEAGYSSNGSFNVFIGNQAGKNETGSNRLYIANSDTSSPLIYGEFDTNRVTVNGSLGVGSGIIFPDNSSLSSADTINADTVDGLHASSLALSFHAHSGADITSGAVAETYIDSIIARDTEVTAQIDAHAARTDNPHSVTAAQAGAAAQNHNHDASYVNVSGGTINGNLLVMGVVDVDQDLYVVGNLYLESDANAKTDIKPIESSLDKINNIHGVSFTWKDEEKSSGRRPEDRHYGVIAQDVEEVLPELVKKGSNGHKKVAYMELIPLLVEAVKEQQATISKLADQVNRLEKEMKMAGTMTMTDVDVH